MKFPYPTLSHFGVELEYMIVSRKTLRVLPIADRLLEGQKGSEEMDIPHGELNWSNELVRHVLEFKNRIPSKNPLTLLDSFKKSLSEANQTLAQWDAMLMPSGMHPDFRPEYETILWPYGNHEIYQRFNEIFDCRGHGWSNLQSTHLNIAFKNEADFVRLHAIIRLLLPLFPALSSSSPLIEGGIGSWKSMRLHAYSQNCKRLPVITGKVIPEPIRSIQDYETTIYHPIQKAIRPWNADQLLDPFWVNARGAIARFDRGAIEIRVLDLQECPAQDLALIQLILDLLTLFFYSALSTEYLLSAPQPILETLFFSTAQRGSSVTLPEELAPWFEFVEFPHQYTIPQLVLLLLEKNPATHPASQSFASLCLEKGNLAERMLRLFQREKPSESEQTSSYWTPLAKSLCHCLSEGNVLDPENYNFNNL